ncbi:hypothetical protein HMPREF0731_4570, partial [Pseudoroseomonas cervicalis ATCC 49957]
MRHVMRKFADRSLTSPGSAVISSRKREGCDDRLSGRPGAWLSCRRSGRPPPRARPAW